MDSKELAAIFEEIAALLELSGENSFKVRTYANAARTFDRTTESVFALVDRILEGGVKGFGQALQSLLAEYRDNGSIHYLEELRSEVPLDVRLMLRLPGLGSKKVKTLYLEHGIASLDDLEALCRNGSLKDISGFGAKSEEAVFKGIAALRSSLHKCILPEAEGIADELARILVDSGHCTRVEPVGELRRSLEVISTVALAAVSGDRAAAFGFFRSIPDVENPVQIDENTISATLAGDRQCQLTVAAEDRMEAVKFAYTGSAEHHADLVEYAASASLDTPDILLDRERISLDSASYASEAEIYRTLDLNWIPPELREGGFDVSSARSADFDDLVCTEDIKGIVHVHTTFSDGRHSLEELANAVKELGYYYLGVSDHSQTATYAAGLKTGDIERQHREIDELNETLAPFRIFKGIESDILADGSLDYPDDILETFDFVIASIHSRFKMDREAMTNRIIQAVRNPYTTILGHMTGRLLLSRAAYEIDSDKVLEAAAEENVAVEINSNPRRLDLDWRLHQQAKDLGIKMPICPDAHSIAGLHDVEYGIGVARKGRLTPADIPTCWDTKTIEQFFADRRSRKTGH